MPSEPERYFLDTNVFIYAAVDISMPGVEAAGADYSRIPARPERLRSGQGLQRSTDSRGDAHSRHRGADQRIEASMSWE